MPYPWWISIRDYLSELSSTLIMPILFLSKKLLKIYLKFQSTKCQSLTVGFIVRIFQDKKHQPHFSYLYHFPHYFPHYIKIPHRGSKSSHIKKLRKSKMSRHTEELGGISLLGNQKTQYPSEYNPSILEAFDNKHPNNDYFVKFICPEFTSLCPITGQPDFATIHIRYIPSVKW